MLYSRQWLKRIFRAHGKVSIWYLLCWRLLDGQLHHTWSHRGNHRWRGSARDGSLVAHSPAEKNQAEVSGERDIIALGLSHSYCLNCSRPPLQWPSLCVWLAMMAVTSLFSFCLFAQLRGLFLPFPQKKNSSREHDSQFTFSMNPSAEHSCKSDVLIFGPLALLPIVLIQLSRK